MKKKAELFFTFLKIPVDYFTLVAAGILAYFIRFEGSVQSIRPVVFNLPFEQYIALLLIIALVWLIFFAWAGLYSFHRRKIVDELSKIILACSTGMTAIIIYMFFVREMFSSRFIVLFAWILSIVLISIFRIIIRKLQNYSLSTGWGAHHIVIVGDDKNTSEIITTLHQEKELGFRIIAHIKDFEESDKEDLLKLHKKHLVDEIIVADASLSRKYLTQLLDFANEHNIIFKYAAGQFESRATNIEVNVLAGVPLIEIKKTKLDGWGKIIKRLLDFFISTLALLILWPLFLFIAILIRLEDSGPAIYKNQRVSKKGVFNVYKFRRFYTKYCTGPQFAKYTDQKAVLQYQEELIKKQSQRKGPLYKVLNDPRMTKLGRFLEKTSIDELPQLFNVWLGNMSLVGPRPHQPIEVDKYEKHHKHVLDIKPGMTGLAQISGRSDLDFEEEVKLDIYYIENWSLKMDFWILLKTPLVVLKRKS
jgi:exopolysaccharide biosynthesis polyprenyl glycosylphosphotransferase